MTKVLRLTVPADDVEFTLRHIGILIGHEFQARKIVDIVLREQDIDAARTVCQRCCNTESDIRICLAAGHAVRLYGAEIVDLDLLSEAFRVERG